MERGVLQPAEPDLPENVLGQALDRHRLGAAGRAQAQEQHARSVRPAAQPLLKVKARDVGGTGIMPAQAPIIGVLLALVFGGQRDATPYWCLGALQELARKSGGIGAGMEEMLKDMQTTPNNAGAINFLVVAAVWFGTSNAAREIVSERAIYMRERMVNLKLFNTSAPSSSCSSCLA